MYPSIPEAEATMARITALLKRFPFRKHGNALSATEVEILRADFKARYHSFKLLLSANNKALEIMAAMEDAIRGDRPFGMSFVRAHATAVSVNVFRILQNLDQLAPGKYPALHRRFKAIQDEINQTLSRREASPSDRAWVIPLDAIDKHRVDQAGSKMANLGEVKNVLGLPVPDGFVITAAAYRRFFEHNDLQTEIDRLLQTSSMDRMDQLHSLSSDIQQRIIRAEVPADLEAAIMAAYGAVDARAGGGVKVSLRSSALGEDTVDTSFAGQYRSELNVSAEDIVEAYKEIVASKYSLQAITYRLNCGILDEDILMCVGCMAMVNASAGGVMYSRNPLNPRDDAIMLNAVWGLPKPVVDGSVTPDHFVVARTSPMTVAVREVKSKTHKFVCYADEGVCRLELTGDKDISPSLNDAQIFRLARIALTLEEHYGTPQDVEWAIDAGGTVHILQNRPLRLAEALEPAVADERKAIAGTDRRLHGGVTASPGAACGPVFVVQKHSDALLFPEGAVLVTAQALPRWAALLGRAGAVVTEQGSVAGHLANVAREFGVPALFGVPGAIERLKSLETVTVDADSRAVYAGRVEALLKESGGRKCLMMESPVHEMLKAVAAHIVPLHLLDPDAAEFRAGNCRTFHDITRFSHEKAVQEMFAFGKNHRFSERASKQLVCDVPMQWWVINLDDGFREDVPGKRVDLENIVSIPMRALWEGIVAVPWAGPPPVDPKGFMSVLMEASANPVLDPALPSPYASRNYFMVSKNFCSLNSRFGFHFSIIEALVGERSAENYISFQFKGGAADYQRKLRRARFVAHILEEFGFRADVKDDGVFARMEGYDAEFMKERLRILGYLIIHTRQLDMIMNNDAAYNEQRSKLLQDIRETLRSGV